MECDVCGDVEQEPAECKLRSEFNIIALNLHKFQHIDCRHSLIRFVNSKGKRKWNNANSKETKG